LLLGGSFLVESTFCLVWFWVPIVANRTRFSSGANLSPFVSLELEDNLWIRLQPPEGFNNHLKDYSDAMGMQYSFVVGYKNGDDFQLPIDAILNTIDLTTG
jgi:hypothetical protein